METSDHGLDDDGNIIEIIRIPNDSRKSDEKSGSSDEDLVFFDALSVWKLFFPQSNDATANIL